MKNTACKPLLWHTAVINGRVWEYWLTCVDLHPELFHKGEERGGLCTFDRKILINVTSAVKRLPILFLHETLHATIYPESPTNEEDIVERLDAPLLKVLLPLGLNVPALPNGWGKLRSWALARERARRAEFEYTIDYLG